MLGWLKTILLLAAGLTSLPSLPSLQAQSNSVFASNQIYHAQGIIKELHLTNNEVVIQHEAISNYMPAMTMPFMVKNPTNLFGLNTNQTISFDMVITNDDAWIENLKPLAAPVVTAAKTSPITIMRDIDPLGIGDLLPVYHFTNESGASISTAQFAGQPYAFTFFFTRCPYPTFCPLLSSKFFAAQKILSTASNTPSQWHLLSISFDPEHDSPRVLKIYAEHQHADASHWSFVTGDASKIAALADRVGETFNASENDSISHNLRTVIIDTHGRVQKIYSGNNWTAEDLAVELFAAAKN